MLHSFTLRQQLQTARQGNLSTLVNCLNVFVINKNVKDNMDHHYELT